MRFTVCRSLPFTLRGSALLLLSNYSFPPGTNQTPVTLFFFFFLRRSFSRKKRHFLITRCADCVLPQCVCVCMNFLRVGVCVSFLFSFSISVCVLADSGILMFCHKVKPFSLGGGYRCTIIAVAMNKIARCHSAAVISPPP